MHPRFPSVVRVSPRLDEAGEGQVECARLARAAVPLDEDGALVNAFHDAAVAWRVAVGDEQAD